MEVGDKYSRQAQRLYSTTRHVLVCCITKRQLYLKTIKYIPITRLSQGLVWASVGGHGRMEAGMGE